MYTVHVNKLIFEWDPKQDKTNSRKHGVSFEDAKIAFFDESAIVFHDPDHSDEEDRFILLGLSVRVGVLIVCHCSRETDSVVLIISARRADKIEESTYLEIHK